MKKIFVSRKEHTDKLSNREQIDRGPLRDELFSRDQLEKHAKEIAGCYRVDTRKGEDRLLPRLTDNEQVLLKTHKLLNTVIEENSPVAPAGEWLLDNFYLVEEQIRTARLHLPEEYSKELPHLANGPLEGYPRVYHIARELIAHSDGRIDTENLFAFIDAYQQVTPLKLGELWAIPIMFRLALIENLRRVADIISENRSDRDSANYWVDRMTRMAQHDPKSLILVIADMARSDPPLTSAFVAEMSRQLQGSSGPLLFALSWIEQRLSEKNQTPEQMISAEIQAQAADQVSFGNSISSLRLLDTSDWRTFVERLSIVEHTLRSDPADEYADMDFETRDRYRHVVEEIARNGGISEDLVAEKAVELASLARSRDKQNGRESHLGYYLIDDGREALENALLYHASGISQIKRSGLAHFFPLYIGGIVSITLLVLYVVLSRFIFLDWFITLPILILLLFPVSQAAMNVMNWACTLFFTPVSLPKMDYSKGIPGNRRTVVVIPTVLSGFSDISKLLDSLEVRFLANKEKNLYFTLLTDLKNAPAAQMPEDEKLVSLLSSGIENLNEKYREENPDTFFLMHRNRTYSPGERIFMGYERKRGILEAFSTFLSDPKENQFSHVAGNPDVLTDITYVITLDTDTDLPRNSARTLIGTIAHPLNRPQIDPEIRVIKKGYGILQPRVAISLSESGISRFVSLFGGEQGIDPYTRVVSDLYQDVFHEGSFIGKGIYDLETFSLAVKGRFPENLILSHDLLEGCYARTGLVSDVQVFEEYPISYLTDIIRRHRWIRGDWQILPWIFSSVPDSSFKKQQNPLSLLSRWKIFDNLRRSLIAPVTFLLFLLSWTILEDSLFWTGFIISLFLIPPVIIVTQKIIRKPGEHTWRMHIHDMGHDLRVQIAVPLLTLAFLPFEAYISLDAIVRSCWRMTISHQNLLEWTTHQEAGQMGVSDVSSSYRIMWPAPVIGATLFLLAGILPVSFTLCCIPFACAWILSPIAAWWISQPIISRTLPLSPEQNRYLRRIARKTWRFFETFVTAEDHHLPPDNYQEQPVEVVAHRTSPTDIGLSLLANLTAYDFGYISAGEFLDRTHSTLTTMGKLKRFRGHFYNWYDTITLEPLLPRYISTVDSGNLVGDLLVLRQGLYELPDLSVISQKYSEGLSDVLHLLIDALKASEESMGEVPVLVLSKIADLKESLFHIPETAPEINHSLSDLNEMSSDLLAELCSHPDEEVRWWADATRRQIKSHEAEVTSFISWVSTGSHPDTVFDEIPAELSPSLALFLKKYESLSNHIPTFREEADIIEVFQRDLAPLLEWVATDKTPANTSGTGYQWLVRTMEEMQISSKRAKDLLLMVSNLADECETYSDIEYEFLYDQTSKLLAIGYNATDLKRDASFYDLLASEARLASFIGIARGDLPQEHWFALGRLLTTVGKGRSTLISWSGSMFEYLMPLLLMPNYENTLLDRTYRAVVTRQIEYGRQRNVPWGISESGYNIIDASQNYQYRAFGVPGLGFKRGLSEDLVIAPYASVMGLMVHPSLTYMNLKEMESLGYSGTYGFYEAVDFTPSRIPPGQNHTIVKSFMVHHQGMALLSLAYILLNRPMQRRFESDPSLKATLMLLQEKMPRITPFYPHTGDVQGVHKKNGDAESLMRIFQTAHTPRPEVHLLSNGHYHVMVNNSGSGYSRWNDLAVTRWREDPTADNLGTFCYIRDLASGEFWSNGYQPTKKNPETFQTTFKQARAEFRRRDREFDTRTEIIVSPEDDVELRRIRVTNRSWKRRTLEFTSYAEVVLAPQTSDESHPAFSNLFVQTELLQEKNAIIATRRPRSEDEKPPWMLHLMTVHGTVVRKISFETVRANFIGRTNSLSNPAAMTDSSVLSNSSGSVLDPVVAIRCTIILDPQETAGVNIFTGVSESRDKSVALVDKYYDSYIADRVSELAWTHAQVVLKQLNATERDARLFGSLASSIIYAHPSRRASQKVLEKNSRGQSGLWGYGISGDVPIVLVRIQHQSGIGLIKEMVQAHEYWRIKGLMVDLVIWNEEQSGYRQELHDEIMRQIPQGSDHPQLNQKGGIFIRHMEQMSDEDRILIQTVARAIISDRRGSLAIQLDRPGWIVTPVPELIPTRESIHENDPGISISGEDLLYFNDIGGFSPDGKEYIIFTGKGKVTPAPWVNVLANENFGTVISESGSAYTWSENAHEFRLTPWTNDPVSDPSGEALYIRDEETGRFWSPTPLPVRGHNNYKTRHGFGYSIFEYSGYGIYTTLTVSVSLDNQVKFLSLRVKNQSGQSRILSVTCYVEWVLGELRSRSLPYVISEIDPVTGAIFAKNPYNSEFPGRVAFLDSNVLSRTITGDRYEFIGRNRSMEKPAAMEQERLSNKVGAGLDPCAALQVLCDLVDGEEREIIFTLGLGRDEEDARSLVLRSRGITTARASLKAVQEFWASTLGAVNIATPDPSVDLLVNGWLLYQTIVSRLWARSGFYQSGGAFGFRDQLQDVMALIHAKPDLARRQILLCAGHQFSEGDVQHWWHPPIGRGVRTHCSDDYLWLPYVTSRYVTGTRDFGILDEMAPFLEGRELLPDEDSYYDLPGISGSADTLYEHCVRAIRSGLMVGVHGLPLMGTGDWNDGMNLVGAGGQGESVWLGFFLYDLLTRFARISTLHNDPKFAEYCQVYADQLRESLEKNGWDGEWYRRAYFDSGQPLGSSINQECRIDSIAQSWSVLSGAGSTERTVSAMKAVGTHLIRSDDGLVSLFTPPFDSSLMNPGYIKGYVPGVRENGGHYSHAAIWVAMAFAMLKDHEQAWKLLSFISPINHCKTHHDVLKYRVEPYVVASDIYTAPPYSGRGGWTWYSGSAGWMYTLIIESLLGLEIHGDQMAFNPCIPEVWKSYRIYLRYKSSRYHISVIKAGPGSAVKSVSVEGKTQSDKMVHLVDDGGDRQVVVELGDTSLL
nr:glucoamylase family protein [uncultured Methanospirillum sp.]